MKESKPSNKPKQTRSILSKVFGKKSSPKHKKQQSPKHMPIRDHVSQCDENGNSKSRLANEGKSSKEVTMSKKNNRKGRIKLFLFRRKKVESDTEIPGAPIYVELSPAKSVFVPDLISDDIYRHNNISNMTDSNSSQSSSSNGTKRTQRSSFQNPQKHSEPIVNDTQADDSLTKENCYDTISVEQKQMNNPVKSMTADLGRQHVKRARSFNSRDLNGTLPFRNETSQPNAAENDVPSASVYAGMCRKSNRMLQTVQESGSKSRLDRSFLRWNSVSDLQYQTSKDKNKAISKMSKVSQYDKAISLQDLSTKHNKNTESANKSSIKAVAPAHDQVTSESAKISKIRPSFDKALSKSEYDLRNFHTSPRSRGILAFKKVNLPNVRRTGTRPVSAILPSTLSIIGEKLPCREEVTPVGSAKTSISNHNRARAVVEPMCHNSPTRAEAEYVDINSIHPSLPDYGVSITNSRRDNQIHENGGVNLGRTHSFQDRYSPPLYRRAHRHDAARPMSCIEQDLTRYPPLLRANERSPSENTSRRGGTVSRSRSRARSIAKRFNISGSIENIAPPKLAVCRSSNWISTDLDANTEYCTMKPLLRDSSTMDFEARSTSTGYSDIPFHHSGVAGRNRIPHRYGNISGPYYSNQIVLDGPYPEPFHPNIRRKLFYALDV